MHSYPSSKNLYFMKFSDENSTKYPETYTWKLEQSMWCSSLYVQVES